MNIYILVKIVSQQKEIFVVDANTVWNSSGNKAIIITSRDNTHLGEGIYFRKLDNIEYNDKFDDKFMK